MTEDELISILTALPGVAVLTASRESGAPEMAWGDSFFFYDPDDGLPSERKFPFATIVTKDYDGFDTASNLNRPGVFRLNLNVGRQRFTELFGFGPAGFAEHRDQFDFTALDRVLPHPVYAIQAWVSVLVPGARTGEQTRWLIDDAYQRARSRYQSRGSHQPGGATRPEDDSG
jgi:hypothetical protein